MDTKELLPGESGILSAILQYRTKYYEPFFTAIYKRVLEEIPVSKKTFLLDAGCGSGIFSHLAATTGARVIGIDTAPDLLEIARKRAPAANFMVENHETLPFISETFDIVAGFQSYQYTHNLFQALCEAKRVLVKHGTIILTSWDTSKTNETINVFKALYSLLPPISSGLSEMSPLSEDGHFESSLLELNFTLRYHASMECPFLYSNLKEGIKSFLNTGAVAAAIKHLGVKIVREALAAVLQAYHVGEDRYCLQNNVRVLIAEKV